METKKGRYVYRVTDRQVDRMVELYHEAPGKTMAAKCKYIAAVMGFDWTTVNKHLNKLDLCAGDPRDLYKEMEDILASDAPHQPAIDEILKFWTGASANPPTSSSLKAAGWDRKKGGRSFGGYWA